MNQVIVIGAGVAGLAAARELRKHGIEPAVLEARQRCGGRILSVHDPLSPVPLELGAEFVHGIHAELWNVLRESTATVVEQAGQRVGGGSQQAIGAIFETMSRAPEQSFAQFISSVDAPEPAKRDATGFVEGFNAAFKEDVSVEWLNLEEEPDRSFRVLNGYDKVPEFMANGLDIRYGVPVRRVRWTRGEVVLETDAEEFRAARVIIAVPLAVLRSRTLVIDPEPEVLRRAAAAVATGHAIRITLRFERAVWEKHQRLSFLQGDAAFPVWWTQYPVHAPVITGWAAGPRAVALHGKSVEELTAVALKSLREILKEDPGEPLASYFHDWEADPWSRGAYSYVRVHGMRAQRALAQPIEGTLCFAGEAAGPAEHMGTVHGALSSGTAAARVTIG